jgi:phosphomannomutase
MTLPPAHIFKSYDIRGKYPEDINEENVAQIITAIYKFLYEKDGKNKPLTVVLSRDMRLSSPSLSKIAQLILVNMGAQVIDIGIASTPTFYFAVYHYGYDAGIQITASHNPKEYNGIKFVKNTTQGLLKIGKPTGMEDVKKMALEGVTFTSEQKGTVTTKTDVLSDEVENALALLNKPQFKKFKIVADAANAMGAIYIDALFNKIPSDLVRMNFTLDGNFPAHQADPMQPENLVDIQKKVLEEKADFGLAPDGDGDRLFIIDEKGNVVSPSLIIGMIAKELFEEFPRQKVVVDQKYILTPKRIVEELGGELVPSKTGHAFITEKLTQIGGIFAGEASAHYYYKATGNAESQVITIASILKILTEENKPLSEVAEEFRRSYESGEINFEVTNAQEIMDKVKETYKDGQFSDLDGITLNFPTWRFNLRNSNTEPLLRFNLEAQTKEEMEAKKQEIVGLITSIKK